MLLVLVVLSGLRARSDEPEGASGTSPAQIRPDEGILLTSERFLMGTIFKISIWAPAGRSEAAAEALGEAFDRIAELENRISSWMPTSETSALNRAAGGDAVPVGTDLYALVQASVEWSRRSDGVFDVTGGPLFALWEEARSEGVLPPPEQVEQRLALVGYQHIELGEQSIRLAKEGMKVGFGAIGKGFAADCAAEFLRGRHLSDFIIDSGGDMVVSGARGDVPWTVAVRHPRGESYLAMISDTDFAVATSGDYERYFVVGGKRYSHILNLRTGWPVRNVAGVTVITERATDADALATIVCGLPPGKRLAFVEAIPDTEALIVDAVGEVLLTKGLRLEDKILKLTRKPKERR